MDGPRREGEARPLFLDDPHEAEQDVLAAVANTLKSEVWNQAITSMSSEDAPNAAKRTTTVSGQILGWSRRTFSMPARMRLTCSSVVP